MAKMDGELLASYVRDRDAAAWQEVYSRYGGLVYSTCLRILGNPADAEDAAAGVFLVLLRKARQLAGKPSLAGWMQWCAVLTSRNAARLRARRQIKEKEAAEMHEKLHPPDRARWQAALPYLDTALAELPEAQREAVILQYMQGRSRSQAAEELGCPEGTIANRARLGLEKLRRHLARRGVELSGAVLIAGLSETVTAPPLALAAKIGALAGGAVAAELLAIAEGTMKAMLWVKIKLVAAGLGGVMLVGGGGAVAVRLAAAEPAPKKLNPDLINLPANTWVKLKPDRNPVARAFGGVCCGAGYLFYWGGGHADYPCNDVELYDVANNKWIQATEPEDFRDAPKWPHLTPEQVKLAMVIQGGCPTVAPILSPKGRPLVEHTYQYHAWFPEEGVFYNIGIWQHAGLFAFDPAKKEWREVCRTIPAYGDQSNLALTYDPNLKTVVAFTATKNVDPGVFAFDHEKKSWVRKCGLPNDACGDVFTAYDSARKVHVIHAGRSWFDVDAVAGTLKPLKKLEDAVKAAGKVPPLPDVSVAYDPEYKATLVITNNTANKETKGRGAPMELWAYDAEKDDWSEVKMAGTAPMSEVRWNVLAYDPEHKCCLLPNFLTGGGGFSGGRTDGMWAFRLKR